MTKQIATANKSGKEFEVGTIANGEVQLIFGDEVKFIKESTYKKNYTTKSVEVKENEPVITPENTNEESIVSKEQVEAIKALVRNGESPETAISELALEAVVEIELAEDDTKELIRIRDNNRQCYKENENRFKATLSYNCAEDEKYLHSYVEKMVVYYKKYQVAKDTLIAIKAIASKKTEEE